MEITDRVFQMAGQIFIGAISAFGAFYQFFSGKLEKVDGRLSTVEDKIHEHDTKIVEAEANHVSLKETVKASFERIDRAIENGR